VCSGICGRGGGSVYLHSLDKVGVGRLAWTTKLLLLVRSVADVHDTSSWTVSVGSGSRSKSS
jgi:hypothetical protein